VRAVVAQGVEVPPRVTVASGPRGRSEVLQRAAGREPSALRRHRHARPRVRAPPAEVEPRDRRARARPRQGRPHPVRRRAVERPAGPREHPCEVVGRGRHRALRLPLHRQPHPRELLARALRASMQFLGAEGTNPAAGGGVDDEKEPLGPVVREAPLVVAVLRADVDRGVVGEALALGDLAELSRVVLREEHGVPREVHPRGARDGAGGQRRERALGLRGRPPRALRAPSPRSPCVQGPGVAVEHHRVGGAPPRRWLGARP
jgi:hypothetical protein